MFAIAPLQMGISQRILLHAVRRFNAEQQTWWRLFETICWDSTATCYVIAAAAAACYAGSPLTASPARLIASLGQPYGADRTTRHAQ
jgi:hypothetical protein